MNESISNSFMLYCSNPSIDNKDIAYGVKIGKNSTTDNFEKLKNISFCKKCNADMGNFNMWSQTTDSLYCLKCISDFLNENLYQLDECKLIHNADKINE